MIFKDTILETKNFQLKIPSEADFDLIFSASRFPGFNDGMQWEPPSDHAELLAPLARQIEKWEKGLGYSFTIETKTTPSEKVGRISLRKTKEDHVWTIGFWVHPQKQNKGIMTEVLEEVIAFAFEQLDAKIIKAYYAIWNKASEKVLLKNGFKFVQHLAEGFKKNGKWIPENEFSLYRSEYGKVNPSASSCQFCQRLENNPNTIYRDEKIIALLDIDPISLGHVLVCPRDHYENFHQLPDALIQHMMLVAKKYLRLVQRLFRSEGYSLMLNAGKFNDLGHCHLHIFPRNTAEEFGWTYAEKALHDDAINFAVLKQLLQNHL